MTTRRRVLAAMSGGVDSSVAAGLLVEQGYDVVGVFMRLGADRAAASAPGSAPDASIPLPIHAGDEDRHRGCCSAADAADARVVAARLSIPFYVLNFEQEFDRLIDHFADEYAAARTPNPCVRCNQWLKFGRLAAYADAIGADLIATGHYARVEACNGHPPRLLRALDRSKDQSYFLFSVKPAMLRRTLFPLGGMNKAQVRAEARRLGLRVHDKPESQDICFVPGGDYARIVRARRPGAFVPGDIRHHDGRLLGRHGGLPNFTVGQRRGVGVAVGTPVYVSRMDPATGTLTVGPHQTLRARGLVASEVRWLRAPAAGPIRSRVQIRYNHTPAPATVEPTGPQGARVVFDEPQWAVTPGQAVVFYCNDEVIGGGWIERPTA